MNVFIFAFIIFLTGAFGHALGVIAQTSLGQILVVAPLAVLMVQPVHVGIKILLCLFADLCLAVPLGFSLLALEVANRLLRLLVPNDLRARQNRVLRLTLLSLVVIVGATLIFALRDGFSFKIDVNLRTVVWWGSQAVFLWLIFVWTETLALESNKRGVVEYWFRKFFRTKTRKEKAS